MKYFFDIVCDEKKNKNVTIINKITDNPNTNNIVLYHNKIIVLKNDIIKSQNRYHIIREFDFIGNVLCNDESNFLMGYTSFNIKFDNHPNLFFPTNHHVSANLKYLKVYKCV